MLLKYNFYIHKIEYSISKAWIKIKSIQYEFGIGLFIIIDVLSHKNSKYKISSIRYFVEESLEEIGITKFDQEEDFLQIFYDYLQTLPQFIDTERIIQNDKNNIHFKNIPY